MSKEIKRTEELLLLRLGQMVKENVELEQCVHQLKEDFNEVVRQLRGQEERKDEDPERQTLGEMSQMRDHYNKLELEKTHLESYVNVIDSFIKNKELYMPKGIQCPYLQGYPAVASTPCLECDACLRVLDDCGVVCQHILESARLGVVKTCPPNSGNS